MNAPIAWRSVAPADWPYLADLLGTESLPIPRCGCRCCLNAPSIAPPLPGDVVDETRRPLKVGPFGLRASGASRALEIRALERLRVLGEVEELAPGHRHALGIEPNTYERVSRADYEAHAEAPRVDRRLSDEDRGAVLRRLKDYTVRKSVLRAAGGRDDWMHEVLLEIEQPPADVEQPDDLEVRIARAAWRYEKHVAKQVRSIPLPRAS